MTIHERCTRLGELVHRRQVHRGKEVGGAGRGHVEVHAEHHTNQGKHTVYQCFGSVSVGYRYDQIRPKI